MCGGGHSLHPSLDAQFMKQAAHMRPYSGLADPKLGGDYCAWGGAQNQLV